MGAKLAVRDFGLFSDEVFTSTDLNRRSGEVLNRARNAPVTIARNNERFALFRRDQAAGLVKGLRQFTEVVQLTQGVIAMRSGSVDNVHPGVVWMRVFDESDRLAMLSEVLAACEKVSAEDGDWDTVGDIVHQWRESAAVLESGVLQEAMNAPADEQPLADPSVSVAEPAVGDSPEE